MDLREGEETLNFQGEAGERSALMEAEGGWGGACSVIIVKITMATEAGSRHAFPQVDL